MFTKIGLGIGKAFRGVGHAVDVLGRQFEVYPYIEKLQPSIRVMKLGKKNPSTSGSFIASSATVIGDVKIGTNSSVWYGAVLRADTNRITIGDSTSIGDNTMIHCDGPPRESPAIIGNRVVIGSRATVHGAILEDECVVGDNATVLDLAVIRKNGVLAPGSILTGGKEIKTGELWAGVPAKFERKLTATEISRISENVAESVELATIHAIDDAKTWEDLYTEREEFYERVLRSDYYRQPLSKEQYAERMGDVEGHSHPGRVLDSAVSSRQEPECRP